MSSEFNIKSPRGRKPKKDFFRGTPSKINDTLSVKYNLTGLKNIGQNVCFFNSVIQSLYTIESFCEHVRLLDADTGDPSRLAIKELFSAIEGSESTIETYKFIKSIDLPGYEYSARAIRCRRMYKAYI